ncbi:LUD domain-containing protein [Yinghuangia aomiensis]|uniref:LUD domain-containing protein n=1 Tax=Yinghuangia aomiensis TaxID=676205 RepID=A0ABP9I850_9ACTN
MTDSRSVVLARIRAALGGPAALPVPDEAIARAYRESHVEGDLVALLAENLTDYRAHVHRSPESDVAGLCGRLLAARGTRTVAVPADLPGAWIPRNRDLRLVRDDGSFTAAELDRIDSVITGCAVAVAETGTLVLDAGPGQGRRILTLVPDHHICVVRTADQIVASVPQVLRRLDPRRPQTWISGPSATSDIELDRVEGVHGPRTLDVVLVAED